MPAAATKRIDGLRLIGLFKIGKAVLLLATTYGLYRLLNPVLVEHLRDWLNTLTDTFERRLLERALDWLDSLGSARLGGILLVTALYTAVLLTEGIGLWLRKTWAEWLTVVATGSLIPFELYQLFFGHHHKTYAVLGATTLNVIIVIYLVHQLRKRPPSAATIRLNPRLRRIVIMLLLAAAVGWSVSQQHRGARADASLAISAVAPDELRMGSLTLEPCDIGRRGNGAPTMRAYCAGVDVPENHAAPNGRHIKLHVALVRAEAAQAEPDLVTFLDGGPGGAATDDYPSIAGAFGPLRRQRAVLLVDQRGTGGSNALDCNDDRKGDAATNGTEVASGADAVRACVARLAPRAAPQFYSTSDAVEDLELVRRALGSPPLDLIGVSYGTRMAQQYARRHPDSVRAIVLDSAVPNALVLGSEHSRNLEDTLVALFKRCAAEQSCAARYGDPDQTLRRLLTKLRAHPQQLTLRDPFTFRVEQKTIGPGELVQLARLYAYSPYTAALLPYVLQEADAGHYEPLLGQAQVVVGDVSDSMTGGMGLSVICTEDADRLVANPADANTVMGNALTDWLLKTCPLWPHGSHPADFNEPLDSGLPVLLLAGEHDPVTPPRYATQIARTLPHSRVLEVAGQGHGLVSVGCMPRLLDEFLRTLDARALDATCLKQLGPTPFFIDANGSTP